MVNTNDFHNNKIVYIQLANISLSGEGEKYRYHKEETDHFDISLNICIKAVYSLYQYTFLKYWGVRDHTQQKIKEASCRTAENI